MSHRWIVAIVAAGALLLSGCGSDKVVITTPTAKTKASESKSKSSEAETTEEEPSTEAAPGETLDPSACADLYSAKLDLILAGNAEEAQPAADTLSKFDPPADVQEAIDHFVEVGGVQFDDPDYNEMNGRIDEWSAAVCPQ
jgi:PBP1b-binding outer membrane lipoprotein LpoB